MKNTGNIAVKIKAEVSFMTILKWRLLGFHKLGSDSTIIPEGYSAGNSKLFKIEVDNAN